MAPNMRLHEYQMQRLSELYASLNPVELLDAIGALGFSAQEYLLANRDLVDAGLDEPGATYHYLTCGGLAERRRFNASGATSKQSWLAALDAFPVDQPESRILLVNLLLNRIWSDGSPLDASHGVDVELLKVCRRKAIRPVLIVGDSHCQAYLVPHEIAGIVHVPLHVVCHAGSAAGLANPHSRSGFGMQITKMFDRDASTIRDFGLPCFFKFGQVDAEFVWVFKRVQQGKIEWEAADFEQFACSAVSSYMDFVERLANTHQLTDHMRVMSVFPPTLSDTSWHAGYVNARVGRLESDLSRVVLAEKIKKLSIPTQRERTRLHALWNALVMRECACRGLLYVDDFQILLGYTGLVDSNYTLGHDGADHHLDVALMDGTASSIFARYALVRNGAAMNN